MSSDGSELTGAQALFIHERLIEGALDEMDRSTLLAEAKRRKEASFEGPATAYVGVYEHFVAQLFAQALELDVAVISGELQSGQLVALTQDFYIRRDREERGSFKAGLDSDRKVNIHGAFSTSRLVGSTGQSETFGHKRFSMLAYVAAISDDELELRPLFIGWRIAGADGPMAITSDRREIWPQQIEQFEAVAGKRATAEDRAAVKEMSEAQVKAAFADIVGEPFVPADWGGETSDLSTNRLTMNGRPLSAAFAFKGPGLSGRLQISGMGKNGDQAIRLAHESVDLYVVQHHDAIAAAVSNLLSALARSHQRHFMVIDGETTATILRAYDKLP